jgi:hypothetical protein
MRTASGFVVLVVATVIVLLGVATVSATATAEAQSVPATCRLFEEGSDRLSTASCLACHPWGKCHPVDVDYAEAQARGRHGLRPEGIAVGRGAFLPAGQVRCVSCHDRSSRARHHLAVSVGSHSEPSPLLQPGSGPATGWFERLCMKCHDHG